MNEEYIYLFRALADSTRQEILELLADHERNVNELCEEFDNMTQPTISHHLQILKRCRLVAGERRGRMIYYSVNRKVLRNGFEDFIARFDIEIIP